MNMTPEQLQKILEAALMVAGRPLTVAHMQKLFDEPEPSTADIKTALEALRESYQNRGIDLCEIASGFQFQAKQELSSWLCRLWEERPPRYSRAILETLALIAYRQPITRAEVEEIRGVSVSSHITKTLQEREWIRIIGYRDVPGKPALYGTTKAFLDHFNLKSLDELPTLAELKDLDSQEAKLQVQLEFSETSETQENTPATDVDSSTHNTDESHANPSTEMPIHDESELQQTSPIAETETPEDDASESQQEKSVAIAENSTNE